MTKACRFLGNHSPHEDTEPPQVSPVPHFLVVLKKRGVAFTSAAPPFHSEPFRSLSEIDTFPVLPPAYTADGKISGRFTVTEPSLLHGFRHQLFKFRRISLIWLSSLHTKTPLCYSAYHNGLTNGVQFTLSSYIFMMIITKRRLQCRLLKPPFISPYICISECVTEMLSARNFVHICVGLLR